MSPVILLDSGPLGLLSNRAKTEEARACAAWLRDLSANGVRIIVPEIADYEVRREQLRANKAAGVARLDALLASLEYLPINTAAMRQAAIFWADARRAGRPT